LGAERLRGIAVLTSVLLILIVFYAGALCVTARAWLAVRRGAARYAALRDVTGIGDRAALARLFGAARPDGAYEVSLATVLQHRRWGGVMLTDAPVHALFFIASSWAALNGGSPAAAAIACGATAHALLLGAVSLSILAAARQALLD
jgi:hypothetical protein